MFGKQGGSLTPRKRTVHPAQPWIWALLFLLILGGVTPLWAQGVLEGVTLKRMPDGLTVLLKEDRSAPVVAIQVWVKTGSSHETPQEAGITHLIEHMIFKGTPSRKPGEIARSIEACGGEINAYTSLDRTVYYCEVPSRCLRTGLEVLLDAVAHASFDPVELKKEKEVVLEEYRRSLDRPETQAHWALMRLAYGKHPYGRPIIGCRETILSVDRNKILDYRKRWYVPSNMVVVAVGDFKSEEVLEAMRSLGPVGPSRKVSPLRHPPEPLQQGVRLKLLAKEVNQVYLALAWHVPRMGHPDLPALEVLSMILGEGDSSRLGRRLRLESPLVLGVGSGLYILPEPGLFSISATLQPERIDEVLRIIAHEVVQAGCKAPGQEELDRAKALGEAEFVFALETMGGQARTLGYFQSMMGDYHKAWDYLQRLRAVKPADVLEVARRYLSPERLSVVLLAPKGRPVHLDAEAVSALFQPWERPPSMTEKPEVRHRVSLHRLPNGLRLVLEEDRRVPAVAVAAVMLGGLRLEPPRQAGISNMVSRMLTRGTAKRSSLQIASTVEGWGGSLEGFSGRNSLGLQGQFLSRDLYPALELISDLLLHPGFSQEEIAKVKEEVLGGIRAKKDRPEAQLFELFYATLFPDSPLGRPLSGTEESVASLTREDLVGWYRQMAIPSRMVVAVVGDIRREDVLAFLGRLWAGVRGSNDGAPEPLPLPPLKGPREAFLVREGAQTHLAMGYRTPGLGSPLQPALALLDTALSGQGGRLFVRLRDQQSLAYAVGAFRALGLDEGAFGVYLACDPAKVPQARKTLGKELEALGAKGLGPRELSAAKGQLLGSLELSTQRFMARALRMALDELYGLGYDHQRRFAQEVEGLEGSALLEAARKVLVPARKVVVAVGPGREKVHETVGR